MPSFIKFLSSLVFCVNIFSTLYSGTINPGIEIQIGIKQQDILKYFSDRKFCRVCEVIRLENCLHCIECDVCINERSHHSSLFGKCIGQKNFFAYWASMVSFSTTCILILGSICLGIIG